MENTLLLLIDTAHPTARVVLGDGEKILGIKEWANAPQVGINLLIYIEELLKECGREKGSISRIGVHPGPGSYGLVREGITTATMLVQAVGAELVSISEEGPVEALEEARKSTPISSIEPKYS